MSIYGPHFRFLASCFVDAGSVRPTAEVLGKLLKLLGGEMLPVTAQEGESRTPRVGFVSPDDGKRLIIASSRVDFARMPTSFQAANLGDFRAFCEEASKLLGIILTYLERKAHRFAAVQEGLVNPEMDEEAMKRVASRLFRYPPSFASGSFEWDYRLCTRIPRKFGGVEERTNTIVTAKRIAGQAALPSGEVQVSFDAIRLDLDINTSPDSSEARFDKSHLEAFLEQSPSWHRDLESEIAKQMGLVDE